MRWNASLADAASCPIGRRCRLSTESIEVHLVHGVRKTLGQKRKTRPRATGIHVLAQPIAYCFLLLFLASQGRTGRIECGSSRSSTRSYI